MNKAPRPNTEYHQQKIGKINTLLREFHSDKWGTHTIKDSEAAKRYGDYARELSQVLIELRNSDSFSSTWAGEPVHLIYKNKKEGKIFSRKYTLTTPDKFLKDATEYVSTGPISQEEETPSDTPQNEEPPQQETPQEDRGFTDPYFKTDPNAQQEGESREAYIQRMAEVKEKHTKERLEHMARERNIYFDFENLSIGDFDRRKMVENISFTHPGVGNKDWLLNSVIKINPFTDNVVVERERGRQTIYIPPHKINLNDIQSELGGVFFHISQGKDPKELKETLAFETIKQIVSNYKFHLTFDPGVLRYIAAKECLETANDFKHILRRFGADSQYLKGYQIFLRHTEYKSNHSEFNKTILINDDVWKQGSTGLEQFLADCIHKIKQNSR